MLRKPKKATQKIIMTRRNNKLRPTILVIDDGLSPPSPLPEEKIDCPGVPFRGLEDKTAGYCCLDHTADIGIRAWGKTFESALSAVGLCFFSVMSELDKFEPLESRTLEVTVDETEDTMILWHILQELLVLYGTEYFIACGIKIERINKVYKIYCWGERFDRERHVSGTEVKGITMHELSVVREEDKVVVEALLDI